MTDRTPVEHGYSCQEVVELASDYLEGAMTSEQMTRFELHLNLCDGCAAFVEQVRATVAMAHVLPEDEISPAMRSKLLAAFRDWTHE